MLTFTRNIRLRVYSVALSSLVLSPLNLYASENPPEFDQCLVNLKQNAISAGVNTETIEKSFQNIAYSEKVIELDRKQPEFTSSFSRYLNLRVNDRRVKTGREMLAQHRSLLQEVTRKSGVPAQYIVAFWGLETNYGGYLGNMSTLDSLATLACDRRRSAFFTGEFIAALRLIEKGDASAESMRGSWAGAVGNFQFMPSNYLTHAHDHDGDGKRDLWNSLEDAAMSAGLFLKSMGWETGTRWGREVKLPAGFDYAAAGLDQPRELEAWRKMGLRTADGKPLPKAQLKASLLVPAGHKGPKFLVYSNFRVIMGWNRSEYYAISVGHLADRINGAGTLRTPPPQDIEKYPLNAIRYLQEALNEKGFNTGKPDGIMGPATRKAIRAYQARHNMIADGYPDKSLLQALGISLTN